MTNPPKNRNRSKEGAALLIALAVLIILSLIVGSFAFEVKLESMLVSHKRKRFHAEMLANSGVEYAKALLDMQSKAKQLEIEGMGEDKDDFMKTALYIKRGIPAPSTITLGMGKFTVTVEPAEAGRNVNLLTRNEWIDILEMANVPSTEWDIMLDCLKDWIDEGDFLSLNGAESDDPFYQDAGYPVKNGPLDSVDELLLIKGWGPDILYGREADDEDDAISGIADKLTVWGDGKVNLNAAGTSTLLSFAGYEEWEIEGVMEARWGEDGEENTLDDGIKNLAAVGADANKFKLQSDFVKVTSVGDVFGKQYRIECIFLVAGNGTVTVYRKEGRIEQYASAR